MQQNTYIKYIILLCVICFFSFSLQAQTQQKEKKTEKKNYYTIWGQLAMLGKSQAEIELYLQQEIKQDQVILIRDKVRASVLNELRNSRLAELIDRSRDEDDFRVINNQIITAIRYAGLELDQTLQESIKEEFGIQINQALQ